MTIDESTNSDDRFDVEQLLAKCEELACCFEYELAIKFCDRILDKEPSNTDALLIKATIQIDSGHPEMAQLTLQQAIDIDPEHGPGKYIALGQLREGKPALELFERAINLLKREESQDHTTNKIISSTFCSMAEIYLTDLCYDDDAEQQCSKYVELALKADSSNFEAWQTKANFHLSQGDNDLASTNLTKSMQIWQSIDFEDEEYPSYEFRLVCARLLIELSRWEDARLLLEILSSEDDQIAEVWYLLALAYFSLDRFDDSTNSLDNAKHVSNYCSL